LSWHDVDSHRIWYEALEPRAEYFGDERWRDRRSILAWTSMRQQHRLRCRLPGLSGEFREPVDEELGDRSGIFQVGEVAGVDGLVGLRVVGRSEEKS